MKNDTKITPQEFLNLLNDVLKNYPQVWGDTFDNALDFSEVDWLISGQDNETLHTHVGDFTVEEFVGGGMDEEAYIVIRLSDNGVSQDFIILGKYDTILREYDWNGSNPEIYHAKMVEYQATDEETGEEYTDYFYEPAEQ